MGDVKIEANAGMVGIQGGTVTMRVFSPLPDEHPIYDKIGKVSAGMATIEHVLDTIIWKLANLERYTGGAITVQIMSSAPRIAAAVELAKMFGVPKVSVDRLKKVGEALAGINAKRNRIIHDAWFMDTDTQGAAQHRSRGKGGLSSKEKVGFEDIDPAALDELYKRIRLQVDELTTLRGAVVRFIDEKWDKRRKRTGE